MSILGYVHSRPLQFLFVPILGYIPKTQKQQTKSKPSLTTPRIIHTRSCWWQTEARSCSSHRGESPLSGTASGPYCWGCIAHRGSGWWNGGPRGPRSDGVRCPPLAWQRSARIGPRTDLPRECWKKRRYLWENCGLIKKYLLDLVFFLGLTQNLFKIYQWKHIKYCFICFLNKALKLNFFY